MPKLTQARALYYAGIFEKELEVIEAFEKSSAETEAEKWWYALAQNDCLPIEYLIDVEVQDDA